MANMTTTGTVTLPSAPAQYDAREEAQNRRAIMEAITRIGSKGIPNTKGLVYIKSPMDYGAVGDGTTDDSSAIQACADDIDANGGGAMWIDRWYFVGANLTLTNKVQLFGIGPTLCGLTANSSFTLTVSGAAIGWRYSVEGIGFVRIDLVFGETVSDFALGLRIVDCTFDHCVTGIYIGWNSFYNEITGCHFIDTTTGLYFDGEAASASSGVSNRIVNCAFFNSGDTGVHSANVGLYFDAGSRTPVTAGSFVVGHTYAITTVGTTDFTLIGAASNTVGVWFTATGVGSGTGTATVVEAPWDFHVTGCHFEGCGTAGIQIVNGTRRNYFFVQNSQFARMTQGFSNTTAGSFVTGTVYQIVAVGTTNFTLIGASANTVGIVFTATGAGSGTGTALKVGAYAIQNDNAVVWVDKCVAWTDTVLFNNIDGRITVSSLTANPQDHKFAKIAAGEVRVDTSTMYTPYEPWGPVYGGSDFPVAMVVDDDPGTGRLVTFRSPAIVRVDGYSSQMTNASPDGYWKATGNYWLIAQPGDGNNRVIDFSIETTAAGTDNFLRVQISDGTVSPYIDLIFPVFTGAGTFRLVWDMGNTISISGTYSAWTPGATTTEGYYSSTADTTGITNAKYLQFHSLKYGATASTMTVHAITETVIGPFEAAT